MVSNENTLSLRLQDNPLMYKKTRFLFCTFPIHSLGYIPFFQETVVADTDGNLCVWPLRGLIRPTSVNHG